MTARTLAFTVGALTRRRDEGRLEPAVAAALGALAAGLVVGLVPAGGDAAAHLYRALLVRQGAVVWDNFWYAGQYPLASYSLVYALPAALVGNVPLVFGAVVVTAALFASLAARQWGPIARWPSRAFAVLAAGPLFTGAYSYALGFAALVATLWLLQRRRPWPAAVGAALTLGFSPLAFVFLCIVLVAHVVATGRPNANSLLVLALLAVPAAIEGAVLHLFRSPGLYPFGAWRLAAVLGISALGIGLGYRVRAARGLTAFLGVWSAASLVVFLVPSSVGQNVTRLSLVAFPVMLLVASLSGFRPRWLAWPALALALAYNVGPYLAMIPERGPDPSAKASFWTPVVRFLRSRSAPAYRVEVVPTVDHWEAYFLPRAGLAIARGWYRQLDITHNRALYQPSLTPTAYRGWLRGMGIKYVVVARRIPVGPMGADREEDLLTSGRSGLRRVFASPEFAIYRLSSAASILTGSAPARITRLGHDRIAGSVDAPGRFKLRLWYTPYWQVRRGDLCVAPAPGGVTWLDVRRPGRFVLAVPGSLAAIADAIVTGEPSRCATPAVAHGPYRPGERQSSVRSAAAAAVTSDPTTAR